MASIITSQPSLTITTGTQQLTTVDNGNNSIKLVVTNNKTEITNKSINTELQITDNKLYVSTVPPTVASNGGGSDLGLRSEVASITANLNSRLTTNEGIDVAQQGTIATLAAASGSYALSSSVVSMSAGLNTRLLASDATNTAQQGTLATLTAVSGSNASLTVVAAISAGLDTRVTTLEGQNSAQQGTLAALASVSASNASLATVAAVSAGLDARITANSAIDTAQQGTLAALASASGSYAQYSAVIAMSAGLNSRLSANETTDAAQQTTLSQLTSVTGSFAQASTLNNYALNSNVIAMSAGLNTRLTNNEATDTAQQTTLSQLTSVTGSFATNTSLNSYSLNSVVQAMSAGLNARLATVETVNTSQQTTLSQLTSITGNSTNSQSLSAYALSSSVIAMSAGLNARLTLDESILASQQSSLSVLSSISGNSFSLANPREVSSTKAVRADDPRLRTPFNRNPLNNPDAELNNNSYWATYADADSTSPEDGTGGTASITWNTSNINTQTGNYSFLLSKAGYARGQGVAQDIILDKSDLNKTLSLSCNIGISGTYNQGDIIFYVRDNTSGILCPISNNIITGEGKANIQFTTSSNNNYRLIIHVASSSSNPLNVYFDDFYVGNIYMPGMPAMSDWIPYTPTIQNLGSGSIASAYGWYKRVGDSCDIVVRFIKDSTAGSGSSVVNVSYPPGIILDSGKSALGKPGTGYSNSPVSIFASSSAMYAISNTTNTLIYGSSIAANVISDWSITIPVAGWSGSCAVQPGSRYLWTQKYKTPTRVTTNPTNFGEYRSYIRTASTLTFTDTAPAFTPNANDGFLLYGGENWTTSDPANEPSKYEIYVGPNKIVQLRAYPSPGRVGTAYTDIAPDSTGLVGTLFGYDNATGIVTVQKALSGVATAGQYPARDGSLTAISNVYFDLLIADDPIPVAMYTPASSSLPLVSFKNKIINGKFDFWQRTKTKVNSGYAADRWRIVQNGSTCSTIMNTFTPGQTDVPGEPRYYHSTTVSSVAGANNYVWVWTCIEDVCLLANRTVTLSFYAKADAARNIGVDFTQSYGSGGTPTGNATYGNTVIGITTAWKKYCTTVSLPSLAGKTLGSTPYTSGTFVRFWFDAGSAFNPSVTTIGQQSGTFDIANVQLETGSDVTEFEDRPTQIELALCQRYYEVVYSKQIYRAGSVGYTAEIFPYKVTKRVSPTVGISMNGTANRILVNDSGTYSTSISNTSYIDSTAVIRLEASTDGSFIACDVTADADF